jgi:transposase-like protein
LRQRAAVAQLRANQFREQAVELVRVTGKTVAEVARDLQINDTILGNWVKAERGEPDGSGLRPLTAAERAELTRLRRIPTGHRSLWARHWTLPRVAREGSH